jgi:hypothetical protein
MPNPLAAATGGCSPAVSVIPIETRVELRRTLNSAKIHVDVAKGMARITGDHELIAELSALHAHLRDIVLRLQS